MPSHDLGTQGPTQKNNAPRFGQFQFQVDRIPKRQIAFGFRLQPAYLHSVRLKMHGLIEEVLPRFGPLKL